MEVRTALLYERELKVSAWMLAQRAGFPFDSQGLLRVNFSSHLGGEGGIRTREGFTLTRFPSVRTSPLCDPS